MIAQVEAVWCWAGGEPKGTVNAMSLRPGSAMTEQLKSSFDDAMLSIYTRALKEAHYNATRYLHMLQENGGLATAKMCSTPHTSRKVTRRCGSAHASISPWKLWCMTIQSGIHSLQTRNL